MSHATATLLNLNCGALNPAGHPWAERRGSFFDVLNDWRPSILTVQECWAQMRAEIRDHLEAASWSAVTWQYAHYDTVGVWWNPTVWDKLDERTLLMDRGDGVIDPMDRRLKMAKLRHKSSQLPLWAGSFHLTPGLDEATIALRQQMAALMAGFVAGLWHPWIALGGDLNEDFMPPSAGVRSILRAAGLIDARSRLGEATIGDTVDTFNYWRDSANDGRWIDDWFTTLDAVPESVRLVRTDTIAYPQDPPSDHNGLLMKLRYG